MNNTSQIGISTFNFGLFDTELSVMDHVPNVDIVAHYD